MYLLVPIILFQAFPLKVVVSAMGWRETPSFPGKPNPPLEIPNPEKEIQIERDFFTINTALGSKTPPILFQQ